MRPDSVMLFAAGFGTRMGALTSDTPKPMIRVAGRPLIDHALEQVNAIQPKRIVANLHYLPDQIRTHLDGQNIAFSDETETILETGGGLRAALPLLGSGPVFTMNTDAVWRGPNPFKQLLADWNPELMDALLLCIPRANAVGHSGRGDFLLDRAGRLSRGPGLVYTGVQIVKTEGLGDIPQAAFSLNLLWDKMLTAGRLFGTSYRGKWCDVGSPHGMTLAEELIGDPHV
ncbi:nucleotidyltransferase family protein [Thalassobius sp. S69A]|uniref:nucleotidyltransferase family protein n=1 Tax=unclassified Thalassovita TaxID=2619711 RepID=UPI000C0F3ACD|nr:nucleotidyltransferase [Paracoccaceae bacterium]MBT26571.1 nucleotidyltransferase [Paracoccaceae bacterium]